MKLLFVLGFTLGVMSLKAQEIETVWSKGGPQVKGAYGAAVQKFSSIDGQSASFIGGYGGILFTHDVMVGAGAFALLNGHSIDIETDPNTSRQLTYIGLVVERAFQSSKAFHASTSLLAGAGIIGEQNRLPGGGQYTLSSRGAFSLEPSISAELNLATWFRLSGGLSYRWIAGESEYSAPAASITLKFGKF